MGVEGYSGLGVETKVEPLALTGAALHAGVVSWQNPEVAPIIILRAILDLTTVATAAATLSVGTTAVSGTTASANLIDTLDVHSATGLFDNLLSPGSGGKAAQKLAAGKWVSVSEASGNVSGLAATLYIHYVLA